MQRAFNRPVRNPINPMKNGERMENAMKKKALFVLDEFERIYSEEIVRQIKEVVDIYAPVQTTQDIKEHPEILSECQLIFSGWGAPKMDEEFLAHAPKLEYVFYGAGTIRYMVSDAFWRRGIRVSSAWAVNAIPVSEYTLSQILFALKSGYQFSRAYTKARGRSQVGQVAFSGAYESTVGLISLGMIARLVAQRLRTFDVKILAYDPFVTAEQAQELGVTLCSLQELFSRSDVVSLHTPWLKETENMITGEMFASMKQGATFINSARGAVIREPEMIEVLQRRPDLQAVLDVTYPEPPAQDSPLWTMENVLLTPHIAGSMGNECHRHAKAMLQECVRYLSGEPMQYEISEEKAKIMA